MCLHSGSGCPKCKGPANPNAYLVNTGCSVKYIWSHKTKINILIVLPVLICKIKDMENEKESTHQGVQNQFLFHPSHYKFVGVSNISSILHRFHGAG